MIQTKRKDFMSNNKYLQKAKKLLKSEDASKHFRQFSNGSTLVPQVNVRGRSVDFCGGYLFDDVKVGECLSIFKRKIYNMNVRELKQFESICGLVLYLSRIVINVSLKRLISYQSDGFDKFTLNAISYMKQKDCLYTLRSNLISKSNRNRDIKRLNMCLECGLFGQTEYNAFKKKPDRKMASPKVYVHLGILVSFAMEELFIMNKSRKFIERKDEGEYMQLTYRFMPKELTKYYNKMKEFVNAQSRGSPNDNDTKRKDRECRPGQSL